MHYEDAAVRWLAANGARLDTWPADHAARGIVLDGLRDLALLMGQRLRSDPRPLTDDYSTILATLADVAGRADTRQLLKQDQRALLPLVAVQATLRENGQADPCLAQALEAELAERSVPGLARTAQDQIALHYLLPRARIDPAVPAAGQPARHLAAGRRRRRARADAARRRGPDPHRHHGQRLRID